MNLANTLRRIALCDPQRPALYEGTRLCRTYGELAQRAARLAATLRAQGLAPGDRVLLFMRNHPAYLEAIYGCWWAGLAVVPVNAKLHLREAQWIADHAQARWAFVTGDIGTGLQVPGRCIDVDTPACEALFGGEALPLQHRAPADLAWLFYTSGTTGKPKGVMLTHRNLLTMGLTYFADVDPVDARDAIVYGPPMSHGAGLYAIPHVIAGARHVVPASGGFDPAEIFALARSLGRVSMFAAPTIVKRLVDHAQAHGLDGEGFKTIVYGGAPMYAEDIRRALRVLGPRFVQIYGQGETPMVATALSRAHLADTSHPRHAQRLASVGVAQTPVEVRVADAEGRDLPAGEVGEVLVRGDTVMAGYWRDEAATAAAVRDGWLFTGDMGSLDADGFLTLKDRSKDLVISGGSNIYPREVEEALLLAPGVAEVSVVGAPDPEWGEVIVAFVVAEPGRNVTAADLDAVCLQHIARFKRPKRYEFVESLPKNNYGKVLKTELRQRLKEQAR
ncbi:AMP-binding protein [Ramlibacter sp. USB13]|uniref:AMP-binding protein n=1 Tax=Ramlibacter cellulosilyticus TaxID=2764187 RepID=A0A923MQ26_9BURK|nr:AMP-binding protein [Ramlibacter cellulosilyticus]MBC5781762.1 AMP-binding protein [Ramlibacter cellulosilyticus]